METSQLTEEQLKVAFCEVRKAHRLIYEYQRRMQDLTWFIKNKLNFPDYQGWKRFSNTISSQHTIKHEYWSWDWIYTYAFQYDLGSIDLNNNSVTLCLLQISDNGYFQSNSNEPEKLKTFANCEDSYTLLSFCVRVQNVKSSEHWLPDLKDASFPLEPKIYNKDSIVEILYPISLSRFVDEEATMTVLREFVDYCNKNAGTNLVIQE